MGETTNSGVFLADSRVMTRNAQEKSSFDHFGHGLFFDQKFDHGRNDQKCSFFELFAS